MRKLITTLLMSLDGVVSAPERLLPMWDDEAKRYAIGELDECDALLFGRATYQSFARRWPTVRDDEFADRLNARSKYVVSRSLHEATWVHTTLIHGDVAGELSALKHQPGKNIMKYGIGELDEALFASDLVDEIRVSVVPIVLGEGRRFLEGSAHRTRLDLRLDHLHRFRNGIVRLSYAVGYI
jgi:dihydrofolate reductase